MSSIVTAVFKATIGLLVNKGRDKAAEKLKDGDVADQKFRGMIVRELDDIESKLDGLVRKDLLTSISYFRRGVVHLFELLDKAKSEEDGSVTAGTVLGTDERSGLQVGLRSPSTSAAAAVKTVSVAEGLKNLKLTAHLDDADKRALSDAKEGFKVACLKATEAFNNEALSTSDRIQAMVIRVAATILENVDYPEDAIAACKLCLKDLHSMPAVQNSFAVEFKKGFWALFSQKKRSEIICTVYRLNRVIYDVTLMTCFGNKGLSNWPCVDYREGEVDVLRDPRVAETLRKLGMEHLWLPWSFGQEGDSRLKFLVRIAINSQGQLIIADIHSNIKVFDSSGKFLHSFCPRTYDNESTRKSYISDIATDHNDNIYIATWNVGDLYNHFYVYEKTAGQLDTFRLREGFRYSKRPLRLTISENNKVLILGKPLSEEKSIVDVYETDGQFVRSFGKGILKNPSDITAADGCVMVVDCSDTGNCVHIFNEEGDHLKEFKLEGGSCKLKVWIAFHQASGHVFVTREREVLMYTKDGQFVRSVEHGDYISGIAVSEAGRIAVVNFSYHNVVFLQ